MTKKAFTTYEVAEYCQVTPRTVIQWINEDKLKAYRTPGNHSRVITKDFLEFLDKYNMPIPAQLLTERRHAKKRILIVDDDHGVVDSIRRFLVRENIYDLQIAYDGFEAGEKFAEFKPDLIILDIRMPGLDGYKVCANIRRNSKNVKVLFISGNVETPNDQEVRDYGADDYLEKPFSLKSLNMKIQHLFGFNRRASDNKGSEGASDGMP